MLEINGKNRKPEAPVLDFHRIAWPPLTSGRLIRRYQRFLADVRLDTGETVTAHCPNSGRMIGCSEPGRPVHLSVHDSPKSKLRYTWELVDMPASLVPNRLVALAAANGTVPEFRGCSTVQTEVGVAPRTRLDLRLTAPQGRQTFVEVKICCISLTRIGMAGIFCTNCT